MKKLILFSLLVLLVAAPVSARGRKGSGRGGNKGGDVEQPVQILDETERADLLFIREEEKLARDVYMALYDVHKVRAFRKISQSEQRHMDALLTLIEKYEITDPVGDNAVGEFTNTTLQSLYTQLVAKGKESLVDALVVGLTIEDMDIHDLVGDLDRTDNTDVRTVYQNLMKGSRNHLRAFASLLEAEGETYVPVYISQDDYDSIVDSPKERGRVDADGNRIGGRKGGRNGRRGGRR